MEYRAFSCGCHAEVPRNMGRGEAREKRIAAYFDRRCPSCAMAHLLKQIKRQTHIDGTPLTEDEINFLFEKKIKKIKKYYS